MEDGSGSCFSGVLLEKVLDGLTTTFHCSLDRFFSILSYLANLILWHPCPDPLWSKWQPVACLPLDQLFGGN